MVHQESLNDILASIDKRVHPMLYAAQSMSTNILDRMREERIGLTEVFERDEYRLADTFNSILGAGIYTAVRSASFAYLPKEVRNWLVGKELIEIGCGSGRETAEIWNNLNGEIRITAIDPVPRMLDLAEENIERYLTELNTKHPPITPENLPVYKQGSATQLDFDDNSFDASYWAFMLHWTSNPERAISEAVRVVRPGGLIFGAQQFKPHVNPYLDLVVRSIRNSYGFFWKEEYVRWFASHGLVIDIATPAGLFLVRNTK